MRLHRFFTALLVGAMLLVFGVVSAAERRVVLQISDDSRQRQTMVLNVAGNLLGHYGAGNVDVEIVAFGPGLNLLLRDNPAHERIDRLVREGGVRFTACGNTIANMTRQQGVAPELNGHAGTVGAGVVHIMDLVDQGYLLITP
jgi:uncharacterized protein